MCTLNTHTLVLKRYWTGSAIFISLLCGVRLSSSRSDPGRPSCPSLSLSPAPCLLEDEGMSFMALNETAPLQMFHSSHFVHRWDASNQSSQLPVKCHHFPSSQMDLCAIYLEVLQSDFTLNLPWFKSFAVA